MVKVTKKKFYMDGYLKRILDFYKKCIAKKWDIVILIDGREGSGKSTLGSTVCYYLDNTFNLNNIVYTPEQFIEAVENAEVGTAILWDEFVLAGLSTEFMSTIQRTIIKKMTTIRKKRLYIIWVIPSLFMLNPYFIERSRTLLHVYSEDGLSRGRFSIFGGSTKDKLFYIGKKKYRNYNVVMPDFRCKFTDTTNMFYNNKEYELKKDEAINSIQLEKNEPTYDNRCKSCNSAFVYMTSKGLKCRKCGHLTTNSDNDMCV